MRTRWFFIALVALGSFFGGGWLLRRGMSRPAAASEKVQGTSVFEAVLRTIRGSAVDSLTDSDIYRRAASGLLEELDDPYAAIVRAGDPADPAVHDPPLGVYLDLVHGIVAVVAAVPGSPAEQAGLRTGDFVIRIGDKPTARLRPEDVARLLRGEPGTEITLRVRRLDESQPRDVRIIRTKAVEYPGPALTVDNGVVYFVPRRITDTTARQLRELLADASKPAPKGLILDLRGVVEGSLETALQFVDPILSRGNATVVTKNRGEAKPRTYTDSSDARLPELSIVTLVDGGTSGSAEIVAGALQDHDRALLVGQPTFGRGSSQTTFPLGNGTTLRLSTALWSTPRGRPIQRVTRDDDDTADSVAARPPFKTEGGRLVKGGGGIVPDRLVTVTAHSPTDPVLELARRLLGRAPNRQTLLALAAEP